MPLKKINAALGLLSIAAMLLHIGYTVFAYLAFYYDPMLKLLTAIPFMVLACLHAVCGMLTLFLQSDGTRLDLYPRQNARTILQRVSAALMLPLLILHINTFGLLQSSAEAGQWIWFALLMLSQPLFYGVVQTHIAVSVTRGLITLGWLSSTEKQKVIDRVVYILCALAFVVSTFVVVRTELAMFLYGGGAT
jgi:succinate dehydrogenase hydrophobic anchor subunit